MIAFKITYVCELSVTNKVKLLINLSLCFFQLISLLRFKLHKLKSKSKIMLLNVKQFSWRCFLSTTPTRARSSQRACFPLYLKMGAHCVFNATLVLLLYTATLIESVEIKILIKIIVDLIAF